MEFFDVIKNRKSVRSYTERHIEKKLIEEIVDAGRLAPTARNEQPWEFVAISDKALLEKISSICPNGIFIKNASWLIVVFSKDTKYYIEDCSAATENMLLAIQALGLGGCWIAGDKKDYTDKIRELCGVPYGYKLVSMVSVGYESPPKTYPHKKRDLKEVLHWERWGNHA